MNSSNSIIFFNEKLSSCPVEKVYICSMQKELNTQKIELIHPESSEQKYPYIGDIQAGFPSLAEDFFHD